LKILHVINSTKPAGGGPIEAIVQAHHALSRMGHSNEVVCLDEPDSPWFQSLPFPIHATGPVSTKYRYTPRLRPWLTEHARDYDCAIVHGIWLYPSAGTRAGLRGTGIPYFVYTHGMLDPTFKRLFPVRHLLKLATWTAIERQVLREAAAVFFTCEEERRLAYTSFRSLDCEAEIVPYCVGEPPGDPESQRTAFLEKYPQLDGKRIVLFLSRIHRKKGCDILIDAFARVCGDNGDLHLVMAGPDSTGWQGELEKRAGALGMADRITWTGMLTGDLKWGAFRAADVFVLPSHQENFGIAVVEALACSLPVIITDRINIWREVKDDGAAIVTELGVEATVNALSRWAQSSPDERAGMGRNAAKCFATRFQSEQAARNLLKVLARHGVKNG